jgi:predicted short-subunit dehydrogenase-like oxidoreductase (DUF2520 family)
MAQPQIPRIALIGAGRLGSGVAELLAREGLPPAVIVDCVAERAESLARRLQGREIKIATSLDSALLEGLDWLLLAVPDDAIAAVGETLLQAGVALHGAAVLHFSGAAPAELLQPLRAAGAAIGTLHPLRSLAFAERAAEDLRGAVFAFQGDEAARAPAERIVAAARGTLFVISAESKPLYHAAAVFAANLSVVLVHAADELLARAGVPETLRRRAIADLALGAIENACSVGPGRALTGPVARDDAEVVRGHLEALAREAPELREAYLALSRLALALAPGAARVRELLGDAGDAGGGAA